MSSGSSIAKAYVEIIPSMEGAQSKITEALNVSSVGESSGKSIGSSLVSGFTTVISGLSTAATALATTAITSIVAVGTAAVSAGSKFESAFAKVETIMDTSAVSTSEMSDAITKLSNETGIAATTLSDTVYSAISATGDTANAVELAGTATKLATAGFTDANSALSSLTTVINAYGYSAEEAESVSDALITTQNLGVTTVNDLSSAMGKAIATGSAYNISLDNILSGYVSLTKNGINTAESTTYLSSMFNELGDSGSDVSTILQEQTGKSFSELMDDGYSLADVLDVLYESVDGDSTALMNLWSSAEAGKASNAIVSQGLEEFNDNLNTIANSAGATQDAYETMADTLSYKTSVFKNLGTNLLISMYDGMSEKLGSFVDIGNNAMQSLYDGFSENGIDGLIESANGVITTLITEITNQLPSLITTGGNLVTSVVTGALNALPQIATCALSMITKFASTWISTKATIMTTILSVIVETIASITESLPELVQEVIDSAKTFISEDLPEIIDTILQILDYLPDVIDELVSALPEIITSIVDALPELIPKLVKGAIDLAVGICESAGEIALVLIEALPEIIQAIADAIPTLIDTLAEAFIILAGELVIFFVDGWSETFDNGSSIKESLNDALLSLLEIVANIGMKVRELISTALTNIGDAIVNWMSPVIDWFIDLWDSIKEKTTTAWNNIKSALSTVFTAISTVVETIFNPIKEFFTVMWNNVKVVTTTVWEVLSTWLAYIFNVIKTKVEAVFNPIKTFIVNTFNSIKTTITNIWNTISSTISTVINTIKTTVTNVFNSIKSTVSSIWNSIKTAISGPLESAKSTVSSIVNSIKSAVSGPFNALKSTVSSIWNGIKTAMTSPIESAKTTISNAISSIKSVFSGTNLKLNIKLPHISVSGGVSPYGIAGKGSLPKFSVSWYDKGYDEAQILKSATIFGVTNGGQLLGGGESGNEVVVGEQHLLDMIAKTQRENTVGGTIVINVYGTEGQDEEQIADRVIDKLTQITNNRRVVYA